MILEEAVNERLYILNKEQEEANARANVVSWEISVFLASISKLLVLKYQYYALHFNYDLGNPFLSF